MREVEWFSYNYIWLIINDISYLCLMESSIVLPFVINIV